MQHLHHRLLDKPIQHRRDTKLSYPSVRLGDFYPPRRLRLIGSAQQLFPAGQCCFTYSGNCWTPEGKPERVRVHDFVDPELGRTTPYGVYDLGRNSGCVSVAKRVNGSLRSQIGDCTTKRDSSQSIVSNPMPFDVCRSSRLIIATPSRRWSTKTGDYSSAAIGTACRIASRAALSL